MVKAKILNPDVIEIEVTFRRPVREWRLIRDALKRGMTGNFNGFVDKFKGEIADIVAAIEKTIELEVSDNCRQVLSCAVSDG